MVRLQVFAKQLLAATSEALSAEGRAEWAEDTRANWEVRGVGTAYASISGRSLVVEDEQAFLRWLVERYPTEIDAVLKPRNPEWYKKIREQYALALATGATESVPGARLDEGGEFISVTVKPDHALRTAMNRSIKLALAGDPSALQRLFQEAGYAPALNAMPPRIAIGGPDGTTEEAGAPAADDAGGGSEPAEGDHPAGS
jgi:hypothetical protein